MMQYGMPPSGPPVGRPGLPGTQAPGIAFGDPSQPMGPGQIQPMPMRPPMGGMPGRMGMPEGSPVIPQGVPTMPQLPGKLGLFNAPLQAAQARALRRY